MTLKKLYEQIESVKAAMVSAKPRSRRCVKLQLQLRDLRIKQMKMERRADRATGRAA
jgi:hypothetical protein